MRATSVAVRRLHQIGRHTCMSPMMISPSSSSSSCAARTRMVVAPVLSSATNVRHHGVASSTAAASAAPTGVAAENTFRILGLQQIAVGALKKAGLSKLWIEQFGLPKIGDFVSEKENVDEDILLVGAKGSPWAVEVDLMAPLDENKSPKPHIPSLNHFGLWVDDIEAAVKQLSARGMRFAPGGIRKGAAGHKVAFIHPKGNEALPLSGEGCLIELVQAPPHVIRDYERHEAAAKRPLVMIPGPTEYHEDVLRAAGEPSPSHVSPAFIAEFSETLVTLRKILLTKDAQPIVVAGSGTLGWDMIVTNLLEAGQHALIVNTGYFGDSFAACCRAYGINVTEIKAPIGGAIDPAVLKQALAKQKFAMVAMTHVDTSTAVKNDLKGLTDIIRAAQPSSLIAVDGVCSFGAEEFRFDDWGIDAAMTCSQKALGAPPGLCIAAFSQRALATSSSRKNPIAAYFTSFNNWVPIMKKYEAREPSYFATPPVNLIRALRVSLNQLQSIGIEKSFEVHQQTADRLRAAFKALGLETVATSAGVSANTLTALKYPTGVTAATLLPRVSASGVILAGGLHRDIKDTYFRVGHMGVSTLEPQRGHLTKMLTALEGGLQAAGHRIPSGTAVAAFTK